MDGNVAAMGPQHLPRNGQSHACAGHPIPVAWAAVESFEDFCLLGFRDARAFVLDSDLDTWWEAGC